MKAISPVIATVIIVAVTIAVAIAVALWISGMTGAFTGTENLQIVTAYAETDGKIQYVENNQPKEDKPGWKITLEVKNVGTTDVTIDQIFINGKPYTAYDTLIAVYEKTDNTIKKLDSSLPVSIPLSAGSSKTIYIGVWAGTTNKFSSGQMIEVKLHTASGKEYPKMVTLP